MRQLISHIFQMHTIFIVRAILLVVGMVAYVLSPFDLIPEAIFGVIGLIDDVLLAVIVLFSIANGFYTAYTRRQVERMADLPGDEGVVLPQEGR